MGGSDARDPSGDRKDRWSLVTELGGAGRMAGEPREQGLLSTNTAAWNTLVKEGKKAKLSERDSVQDTPRAGLHSNVCARTRQALWF